MYFKTLLLNLSLEKRYYVCETPRETDEAAHDQRQLALVKILGPTSCSGWCQGLMDILSKLLCNSFLIHCAVAQWLEEALN